METELRSKYALAGIMAAELDIRPSDWDDAVQEAVIKFWQLGDSHSYAYRHKSMKNRIITVVTRHQVTGREGHQGWEDAFNRVVPMPDDLGTYEMEVEDYDTLYDALRVLTDKEKAYVWNRFWIRGLHAPNSPVWVTARAKLRRELE